jgi:hypothetical protein
MELKKELARAFAHYENFIRVVIKDEQQLDVYLNATKTWSEEEMLFMRDYWDIDNNGGCPKDECLCDDCDEYTCNGEDDCCLDEINEEDKD